MRYALIGQKLGHSFSKDIHVSLGLAYDHIQLEPSEVEEFLRCNDYAGLNVTIPYKEVAYSSVDILDETASSVGAVNTILYRDGKSIGYNTDVKGMRYMLSTIGVSLRDKRVLILGSGGTSRTAQALCRLDGAKDIYVCSRSGEINYSSVYSLADSIDVIINCTPVGMYPHNDGVPIDLERFGRLVAVADCIYNPLKSRLLLDAERLGINYVNGISMLVAQAVCAEEIWRGESMDSSVIEEISSRLTLSKTNIVLIGMPGSGKSTLGKLLAERLGRDYIDTDEQITSLYGDIPTIISTEGERTFRDREREVVSRVSTYSGIVISTGGGTILDSENVLNLEQNAVIVFVSRGLKNLATGGRPISQSVGVEKLWLERKDKYLSVADYVVVNDSDIDSAMRQLEEIYEDIGNQWC